MCMLATRCQGWSSSVLCSGAGGNGLRAGRMMSLHGALRAQLGVAVPAMSIAKETSVDPEPCLLFFGIVDFLQVCISFLAP